MASPQQRLLLKNALSVFFVILMSTISGLKPVTAEMATVNLIQEVLVMTPIGEIPGTICICINGTTFNGVLTIFENDNQISDGTILDGCVTFSGELKTPIGKMAYDGTGTFIAGKIDVVAKTRIGDIRIISKPSE